MKNTHLLTTILLLVGVQPALSQGEVPGFLWNRTYGGDISDEGQSVQQTFDGGFVVAGYTYSFGAGNSDVWLVRTDAQGDTLWNRTYGGSNWDFGYSVQQTSDSGFVVAGYTDSFGAGGSDFYLIRTDAQGDTLWTRTYGGGSSDEGYSVQQTSDSGFVVAGYTYSFGAGGYDFYLIRTDAQGDTLWTRTYGGNSNDHGRSVQQTADSGFVVAGYTYSFGAGAYDFYLIRTDAQGDTLWTRTYGGSGWDHGYSVQQTSDSGFVVAGYTDSFGAGSYDFYLIRTDTNGDSLWTRTYGGSGSDQGYSVQQTADGGFVVAGGTYSSEGPILDKLSSSTEGGFVAAGWTSALVTGLDVWLVRTDAQGEPLWTRTFGGSNDDVGYSVQQTSDGGFVVAGWTSYSEGPRLSPPPIVTDAGFVGAGENSALIMGNSDVWLTRLGEGGLLQEPIITAVTDVPEDQGGRVNLHWSSSYHDLFGLITQYAIRCQDAEGEWGDLNTVTARQADAYIYFLAPTFGDSTADGLVWSRFQVTAHTSVPAVYYPSPVDSGYSIDNKAPAMPTGLVASVTERLAVSLAWNGPVDHDFDFFRVYRQAAAGEANTLAETGETAFTDTTVEAGLSYDYWVSALDVNGNEGDDSPVVSVAVLGTDEAPALPAEFALEQNYPNPFNPATTIRFALPRAAAVQLVVYNLQGREITTLLDGGWPAGYHHVVWDGRSANGRAAPSGVYIARLKTTECTKNIKMLLLK